MGMACGQPEWPGEGGAWDHGEEQPGEARGGCRWRGWQRDRQLGATAGWWWPVRLSGRRVCLPGVAAQHKYPTGNWRNKWVPFLSKGRLASVPCPEDLLAQRSALCALRGWRRSQPTPHKAQGLPVCLKILKGHRGTLPIILSLIRSFCRDVLQRPARWVPTGCPVHSCTLEWSGLNSSGHRAAGVGPPTFG